MNSTTNPQLLPVKDNSLRTEPPRHTLFWGTGHLSVPQLYWWIILWWTALCEESRLHLSVQEQNHHGTEPLSFFLSLNIYLSSGLSIPLSLRVLSFFLQKTDIVTTDTCETCQCYSGELRCVPKSCPPCASVSTCITYLDLCSKECLRNNITEALATVKFAN